MRRKIEKRKRRTGQAAQAALQRLRSAASPRRMAAQKHTGTEDRVKSYEVTEWSVQREATGKRTTKEVLDLLKGRQNIIRRRKYIWSGFLGYMIIHDASWEHPLNVSVTF